MLSGPGFQAAERNISSGVGVYFEAEMRVRSDINLLKLAIVQF
jgi:hypothetical protein